MNYFKSAIIKGAKFEYGPGGLQTQKGWARLKAAGPYSKLGSLIKDGSFEIIIHYKLLLYLGIAHKVQCLK